MSKDSKILLILTGKTASGKDTIMRKLLSYYPEMRKVVTTTTREAREGERNGYDYNFVTSQLFQKKINNGEFIEHVEYGGAFYGTEKAQITNGLGHDLVWRIDPSRAGNIRGLINSRRILVIYVTVSEDVIRQRLRERNLTEEEIEKRLTRDAKDWEKYKDKYDCVLENVSGKLDQTVKQIVNLIESHKNK